MHVAQKNKAYEILRASCFESNSVVQFRPAATSRNFSLCFSTAGRTRDSVLNKGWGDSNPQKIEIPETRSQIHNEMGWRRAFELNSGTTNGDAKKTLRSRLIILAQPLPYKIRRADLQMVIIQISLLIQRSYPHVKCNVEKKARISFTKNLSFDRKASKKSEKACETVT